MRPLRKDRLAVLKEHKQVGRAVEVDVYDGTCMLARRGIEFLDKIDTVIEVTIRLAAYQYAAFEVLVNVRSAVEVCIDGLFGELDLTIVRAPDVGPAVAVPILGAGGAGTWP